MRKDLYIPCQWLPIAIEKEPYDATKNNLLKGITHGP